MQYKLSAVALLSFIAISANSQENQTIETIPLTVRAGTPLRLYLAKRLTKRKGEPVEAKLLDPVYAFDREVIPAGSQVFGTVVRLNGLRKLERFATMMRGDFTPLHQAEVEFHTLVMPDGRRITLHTVETPGLNSIANLHPKKRAAAANRNTGVLGTAKAQAHDRIDAAKQSVSDTVRAPDKKERLEDFLWAKLPYHPQHVRRGTRFDAVLIDPLPFGTAEVKTDDLRQLGSQPPPDSSVEARLMTDLDSGSAKQGEAVEAVVARPLFSADHKLLLPEGTQLHGAVTMVKRARWLHRAGQLRFNFQSIDLPEGIHRPDVVTWHQEQQPERTLAVLQAAEPDGQTPVKVDGEGGVKAKESKTRFIAPVVSLWVANRAADNDISKRTGQPETNTGGRTLGGASGFGLFGAAASKAGPNVARALGYYGLAWSVYLNVIARGREVQFQKNLPIDIRFAGREADDKKRSSGPQH